MLGNIHLIRSNRLVQFNLRTRLLNTNTTEFFTPYVFPETSSALESSPQKKRSRLEKQPPELEEPWQRKLRFWSVISAIGVTYILVAFGNYGEHEHIFSEVGKILDQ